MRKILFLAFQFLILHVSATTYYVSTNGKPEGDGSKENPYNITTAVKKANPGDVIYLLVCHCAERIQRRYGPGRRPAMRQIEKEGYAWARKGIDSQRAAAAYLKQYAQRQETIPLYMRALGLGERAPSPSEEKYLTAWQEMGFAPEAVALAADKTILKCHELKWPYCNGILKRWHEAGLHTPGEIQSGDRPAPGREDKPRESAWKYV